MERYNYIIVDDENQSHIKLRNHFKPYKNYTCVATFSNPEKALLFLSKHEIDLIFLDIEMPQMSGFQFLEALQKNIFVVIFTAFESKYCLEAHHYYDKDLVFFSNKAQFSYYLPKIITRFEKMFKDKKVVERVKQLSKNEIILFPKKIEKKTVALEDILYIEVIGHNIILKTKNNKEFITHMTLRELLSFLPVHIFFQIKRNMIVNIEHITAFTDFTVCVGGQHHTIAIRKQQEIIPKLIAQKQKLIENYESK